MPDPTHAAFLRAVNLGSTRQVKSAELVACLEKAGFEEVASFRTSGNVVFTPPQGTKAAAKIIEALESALEADFGFEVPVFLRTAAEVRSIAEREPFPARAVSASKGKLQVALLGAKPGPSAKKAVAGLASADDRLVLDPTELYWLPSGGTQDSKLDTKRIDRVLGPYTLRTQGTIEQMASKFFG